MTPPLRVALVIGQLHSGGSERQLAELALGLRGGSCAPYVYCLSEVTEPFGPVLQKAGVPLRVLPRRHSFELRRVIALARFLREDRIDVVLSYAQPVNLYSFLALLLYRRSYFLASSRGAELTESPLRSRVNGLVYRRSGRVVVNSRYGAESTTRIYGVSSDQIEVIHNGVDRSRFEYQGGQEEARRALGLPATVPVVGLVGRLTFEKRVDLFLEAARRVTSRIPECRFLVVGAGDLLEPMKRLATEMGLDSKVSFTGERHDMDRVLSALDLLALSSDFEGLPNVVMEAMAAGRPVVATDLGGSRELIVDGVTGFLVPVGDPGALAEKMIQMLSLPDRGRSLGAAGSDRVSSEFSIAAMVRRCEELFLRVGRKAPPAP
ncbi:MAG: glycosyltransferase [Acidobacteria bacterium]|nr:glycosyltransferase [Acidobacteriota bacterium]